MVVFTRSDWVLFAYIFLLVPLMLIGFGYARRKMFEPHHKLIMTTVTIANWFLIGSVMINTYSLAVEPDLARNGVSELSRIRILLPTLHAVAGILAQIVASYLVFRMWFETRLPDWIKVKNIKRYMRFTLAMWLITATLGLATWTVFSVNRNFVVRPTPAAPTATPRPNTPVGSTAAPATAASTAALPATPGATQEATTAAPATPGATQDATTAAPATPGKTEEATTAAPATPGATAER